MQPPEDRGFMSGQDTGVIKTHPYIHSQISKRVTSHTKGSRYKQKNDDQQHPRRVKVLLSLNTLRKGVNEMAIEGKVDRPQDKYLYKKHISVIPLIKQVISLKGVIHAPLYINNACII